MGGLEGDEGCFSLATGFPRASQADDEVTGMLDQDYVKQMLAQIFTLSSPN